MKEGQEINSASKYQLKVFFVVLFSGYIWACFGLIKLFSRAPNEMNMSVWDAQQNL